MLHCENFLPPYDGETVEDDCPMDEETFAFGSFRLIPAQRMLLADGKPLHLGNRALDILVALVEDAGATIHKDQLIARTWPDTVVDEGRCGFTSPPCARCSGTVTPASGTSPTTPAAAIPLSHQ